MELKILLDEYRAWKVRCGYKRVQGLPHTTLSVLLNDLAHKRLNTESALTDDKNARGRLGDVMAPCFSAVECGHDIADRTKFTYEFIRPAVFGRFKDRSFLATLVWLFSFYDYERQDFGDPKIDSFFLSHRIRVCDSVTGKDEEFFRVLRDFYDSRIRWVTIIEQAGKQRGKASSSRRTIVNRSSDHRSLPHEQLIRGLFDATKRATHMYDGRPTLKGDQTIFEKREQLPGYYQLAKYRKSAFSRYMWDAVNSLCCALVDSQVMPTEYKLKLVDFVYNMENGLDPETAIKLGDHLAAATEIFVEGKPTSSITHANIERRRRLTDKQLKYFQLRSGPNVAADANLLGRYQKNYLSAIMRVQEPISDPEISKGEYWNRFANITSLRLCLILLSGGFYSGDKAVVRDFEQTRDDLYDAVAECPQAHGQALNFELAYGLSKGRPESEVFEDAIERTRMAEGVFGEIMETLELSRLAAERRLGPSPQWHRFQLNERFTQRHIINFGNLVVGPSLREQFVTHEQVGSNGLKSLANARFGFSPGFAPLE